MAKYLMLLTAAYVGGVLRHPHEGAIHVDDEDAKRLLDDKAATDVTADFDDVDTSDDAPERVEVAGNGMTTAPLENPHQAEVPPADPAPAPETKQPRRKAAASQE